MEEDMRAEMLRQQEEMEQSVFKKFFHRKIKQMSCIKKLKFILLILLFAGAVQGYFVLAYFLVLKIDSSIVESVSYFKIVTDRDTAISNLLVFFRESISRNQTMWMEPDELL